MYDKIIILYPKLICTKKEYTSCNFRIQFKGTIFDNKTEMVIDIPYYWIQDTSYIVYKTKLIDMDGEYYKNNDCGVMHHTIDDVVSDINRVLQVQKKRIYVLIQVKKNNTNLVWMILLRMMDNT